MHRGTGTPDEALDNPLDTSEALSQTGPLGMHLGCPGEPMVPWALGMHLECPGAFPAGTRLRRDASRPGRVPDHNASRVFDHNCYL